MQPVAIMCLLIFCLPSAVSAQRWHKKLDDAIAEAGATQKNILLVFSVPDACEVCADLEKNVLTTPEFLSYAARHFVLVRPDFSGAASYEDKADNLLIVEKYDKDGFFPWVVILNASGKTIGKTGEYDGQGPEAYIQNLNEILHGR